jgi:hypothetical protein
MKNKKTDSLSFNRMQMQMKGSIEELKVHFSNSISFDRRFDV